MGRAQKGKAVVVVSSDEDERDQPTPLQDSNKGVPSSLDHDKRSSRKQLRRLPLHSKPTSSSPRKAIQAQDVQQSKIRNKPKASGKTLYSFFNAATQRQKSQQPSSPEKASPGPIAGQEEAIEDDIHSGDDVKSFSLSQAPTGILGTRKRTRNDFSQSSTAANPEGVVAASQKFLKTKEGRKVSTSSLDHKAKIPADPRPWMEKYGPVNLEELAVHKNKVKDVTNWFKGVFAGQERKRLLVLRGPTGSAKTTTVMLLSKALDFQTTEWKNPSTSAFTSDDYVSVLTQFEEFVGRSGNFGTLELAMGGVEREQEASLVQSAPVLQSSMEAVLIEEFPNTFMRSATALQAFRSTIHQYLAANTPSMAPFRRPSNENSDFFRPIVMIISETHISTSTSVVDSFTAQRLLGSDIMNHAGTTVIEFNPIAPTILTKALELVVVKEARQSGRRRTPGPQALKVLAESGDVRNAVSNLEFLCLRGDEDDNWGSKVAFRKTKRESKDQALTKVEKESLQLITNRGYNLDLFHGLGKVLYNKRLDPSPNEPYIPQPPSHLPQNRRLKIPENDPDTVMNDIGADVETFVSALHENYVLSCNSLTAEDTLDCIDASIESLSDADLLTPSRFASPKSNLQNTATENLRQDEIAFHVSVRGLLFALPSPVKRLSNPHDVLGGQAKRAGQDAFKMFFPASIKLWRRREELDDVVDFLVSRLQRGQYASTKTGPAPNMFAKFTNANATATPNIQQRFNEDGEEQVEQTRLGGGESAKIQGLLEYLPYLAILQRSNPSFANAHELEQVTNFRGIGLNGEDDSEHHEMDVRVDEPPIPTVAEPEVEKLVLSDDDIED
ncbi:MAG: Cell cycle checkpoint protein rad17 [Bogoriella megaspora]|nr:MAG: Cell cycle checkpoint protein rad17 [Bogoriella megaspora]